MHNLAQGAIIILVSTGFPYFLEIQKNIFQYWKCPANWQTWEVPWKNPGICFERKKPMLVDGNYRKLTFYYTYLFDILMVLPVVPFRLYDIFVIRWSNNNLLTVCWDLMYTCRSRFFLELIICPFAYIVLFLINSLMLW